MRYYSIDILPAPTPASTSGGTSTIGGTSTGVNFTSHPNGIFNSSALNVEFDFLSSTTTHSGPDIATLTIEGIGLQNLFQSNNFYGRTVVVKAGMAAGLPLAKPAQAGVIWNGMVNQSFGNWFGTEMTLDLVMFPSTNYTIFRPGQFVLNWPKGTSLQAALTQCLNTAYPSLPVTFAIGSQYVLNHDVLHVIPTLDLLQSFVRSITSFISAPGVSIAITPSNTISVFDGSMPSQQINVAFEDLIGQPTWIESLTMQFMTVMRADIQVNSIITMPQGIGAPGSVAIAGGQASSPNLLGPQYKSAFQGNFLVNSVRYIGNYRDAGPQSWVTVFQAVPQIAATSGDASDGGNF